MRFVIAPVKGPQPNNETLDNLTIPYLPWDLSRREIETFLAHRFIFEVVCYGARECLLTRPLISIDSVDS